MDEHRPDNTGSALGNDHPHGLELAKIDHEEYDALADLFLGDGGFAPEPMHVEPVLANFPEPESEPEDVLIQANDDEVVSEEHPNHATHTPVLQLTRHEDDAKLGSGSTDHAEFQHSVEQDFEDGFEDESYETGFGDDAPGIHVLETLDATDAHASELLAELMGSGDLIADSNTSVQRHGSPLDFIEMPKPIVEVVVLGHLPVRASLWARQYACNQAKELRETVALIRIASESISVDLITDGEKISARTFTHLDGALEAVSKLADRVILRVDEACEPELLDRPEVEEITVLTGADEAAVVASYRLIKTLDATLGEQHEDGHGPTLRVAVMGASRESAMDACTKLGNAVETFISRPIEIVIGASRIDATGTTNLYRDSMAHRASQIIAGLVRASSSGDGLQITQVEFPTKGVSIPEPKPASRSSAEKTSHKDDAPTLRDGLCAMIPGLSPIEARCPKAVGVDLAMDTQGQLHLIVCDADTDDALNRLMAAQSWARNNFGLLLRAEPGLQMPVADRNADTDAQMHLISIDPRSIREIYDTQVRVYSLARVRVGKVIAQVATLVN